MLCTAETMSYSVTADNFGAGSLTPFTTEEGRTKGSDREKERERERRGARKRERERKNVCTAILFSH